MQEQLKSFLSDNFDSYMQMLRQMVEINSFTGNPAGVNELAALTAQQFALLGFSAESIQSENHPDYGNHLVLMRKGSGPHKIGLISHLDTVFTAEEEAANDFVWREVDDRIYGPGTIDIKGGTVLIYMMLEALQATVPELFEQVTWVILLNSAEERGASDFSQIALQHLQDGGLAFLVFEHGHMQEKAFNILVRRKGMAGFKISVNGRSSHAGIAHAEGANAIVQLADVVQRVHALTDYERDITFNVGTISGGVVTNRVPHYAEAFVEMRCYDSETFDQGVAAMLALNGLNSIASPSDGYACNVTVELLRKMKPWPENIGTRSLFEHWDAAAKQLGYVALATSRGGLSDGNPLWDKVPTIDALGPSGANAHCAERSADGSKDQEYASRSSFVPKTLLNTLAVINLINAASK